jgi:hypothetical protein
MVENPDSGLLNINEILEIQSLILQKMGVESRDAFATANQPEKSLRLLNAVKPPGVLLNNLSIENKSAINLLAEMSPKASIAYDIIQEYDEGPKL